MTVNLNPYLGFRDTARQAIEFYHSVFGGKLEISTFGEMHASEDPAEADKVMHAQLTADNGLILMASDAPNSMEVKEGSSISVSLSGDDADALRGYWEKLVVGGEIAEPLVQSPWGDTFGMVTDRFGTFWMVNISAPADQ